MAKLSIVREWLKLIIMEINNNKYLGLNEYANKPIEAIKPATNVIEPNIKDIAIGINRSQYRVNIIH